MIPRVALTAVLLLAWADSTAAESDWSYRGRLEAGSRHYLVDRDRGLKDDNIVLEGELEATYDPGGPYRIRIRPYLALDPLESSRNRYEPLDAYGEVTVGSWSVRAGQMIESWAIADIFNPVDVLNRRDLERNFYDPPKLGEVMVRLRYVFPEVEWLRQPALSLYLLPLHRDTPLPGNQDRFRLDVTGDGRGDISRHAVEASPDIAYAARLGATLGDADVFLFYFGGPTRIPGFAQSAPDELRPVFYRVDVVGAGVQWPTGPWLFKLETAYTSTRNPALPRAFSNVVPDSYFQYVVGLDRTFTDVLGKNEVTLTLEYAGEDQPGSVDLRALRPYKSDLFLGLLWQFHDLRRTEIRASAAVDVRVNEQLYLLSARTLIYRNLWLVAAGQFVNRAPDPRPGHLTVFNIFPDNSNLQITLRYEF